jgi:hypothetical protein
MNEIQNNNAGGKSFNNNQINVSTAMITIWDSVTGAQLKLSALNNGFGVAIWLPFITPDGYRKYPSENRFSTVLTQKNALAFERVITDIIIPAYDKGNDAHAGIFTNNANSTMLEVEVRDGNFYLLMHRNCDATTKIPKDTIRFKFDSTTIVDKFNSANGDMEIVPIQADFFVFAKAIYAYNSLAGGYIAAHGASMANAYHNQKFMEYMRAIADSVHAQLPAPTYEQNGGYHAQTNNTTIQQNYDVNNIAASANLPSVNPTEVTSLSDLIG